MSDTFGARSLQDVPERFRDDVAEEALKAKNEGLLMCVRLQTIDYGDEVPELETVIYGVYTNTEEWVEDYERSGGVWGYSSPEAFLAEGQSAQEPKDDYDYAVLMLNAVTNELNNLSPGNHAAKAATEFLKRSNLFKNSTRT